MQPVPASAGIPDKDAYWSIEANDLLNASLTDQILQYQYIQKLTDKIQVMLLPSGNQTIFDLKSLLGQTDKTAP